jgi:Tol biopolymer transport system component
MTVLGLVAGTAPVGATGQDLNGRIAFGVEESSHVFTANPDGTHQSQLLPARADCPGWSHDGTKIVVCVQRDSRGLFRSATVNADGTGYNLLDTPGHANLEFFCYAWSPDDTRLACEGNGSKGNSAAEGIYTMRSSDGGGLVRLTKNPFGIASCCPFRSGDGCPCSYSPDGSQLEFNRFNQRGQSAVFIVNIDGTGAHQVTPWGLGGLGGNWSRDGKWIVFGIRDLSYPFGQLLRRGQLFLVHPDGTGLHKIDIDTNGSQYFAKQPTWSPDGTRILFVMYLGSNTSGGPDLFTMNADGSHLTQVTHTPATENVPNWGTHPLAT